MVKIKILSSEERTEQIQRVRDLLRQEDNLSIDEAFTIVQDENEDNEFMSLEERTVNWINKNKEILKKFATKMHEKNQSHNDAFNRKIDFLHKLTKIAWQDISRFPSEREYVDMQVRSEIANRIHDKQWYEEWGYIRSDNQWQ